MNKKKLILILTSLVCVLALSVGVTLATTISAETNTLNVVTFGNVHVDLVDIYTKPDHGVSPGETIPKIVSATNTGKNTSYVRISADKAWFDPDTDTELDRIQYDPDYIILNIKDPDLWVLGTDGYYYYQKPLEPGETAENLIESFSLPADWNMEGYYNLNGHITVKAEAIQYDNFYPIKNDEGQIVSWGDVEIQDALPEVEYSFTNSTDDSNVTFQYGTDEFVVLPEDKDLFQNFKDVMPGDSRDQTLTIKNENQNEVGIWVYALPADITDFSDVDGSTAEHQKVLSDDLVDKLTITITKQSTGEVLYDGKLVGKDDPYNMQSPENALYLGQYSQGESEDLLLTLHVPAELDNYYDDAIAKIEWIFVCSYDVPDESSAPESSEPESSVPDESSEPESSVPDESSEPESSVPDESSEPESSIPESSIEPSQPDEPSEPVAPPIQTGDNVEKYILIGAIVVVSLAVIIVLFVTRKKKDK